MSKQRQKQPESQEDTLSKQQAQEPMENEVKVEVESGQDVNTQAARPENGGEEPVVEQAEKKVAELQKKLQELEEQNLRIRAEFANFKRRVEKERLEWADYLKGEFIKKLLPILDDFKMMLEKAQEGQNEQSVLEGAKIIYQKLQQILEREGLERIESLGKPFDPQIHEALMMQPTTDREQHEKVVQVFQEGYRLKDRLLRPSRVVVGKLQEETEAEKN